MTTNYQTMPNAELDRVVANAALRGDDLPLAMNERTRRVRLFDAVIVSLRADLELADVDAMLVFGDVLGTPGSLALDLGTEIVDLGLDAPTAVSRGRRALRRSSSTPRSVKLTAAGAEIVGEELERCSDRASYAGIVLRGRTLTGEARALADLADGIETANDDDSITDRAFAHAADSRGNLDGDALEARAVFIARAYRAARDRVLAALR